MCVLYFCVCLKRGDMLLYVSAPKAEKSRNLCERSWRFTAVHSFKDSIVKGIRWWVGEDRGGIKNKQRETEKKAEHESLWTQQREEWISMPMWLGSVGKGVVTSGFYTCMYVCVWVLSVSPCLLRLLIFRKQVPSHNLLSLCCLISSMISGWIFSLSSLQKKKCIIGLREWSLFCKSHLFWKYAMFIWLTKLCGLWLWC